MIRRHVLAAIAKGVAAPDEGDDVARKALARIDWVLRGRARSRLERSLMDAAIAIAAPAVMAEPAEAPPETVVDVEGGGGMVLAIADDPTDANPTVDPVVAAREALRHQLRAAALVACRRTDVDLADRTAVDQAYAATIPLAPPPRLPIASIAAIAGVLAISTAAATAAAIAGAPPPMPGTYTRPTPPRPVGVFEDGGVPGGDPAIEALLRDELPRTLASRGGPLEPPALTTRPRLAQSWRGLVEEVQRYDTGDTRFQDGASDLTARVQVLSDQLAAAQLGYYVDLQLAPSREPIATAFRIEKVTFVRAGDDKIRVFDVRRLGTGKANASGPLGMKPEGLADPLVMRDQIDEHVRTQLMPVLDGHSYGIADDGWTRTARGRAAQSAITRAIRRELGVALNHDVRDANRTEARLQRLVLVSVRHHEAQHGLEQETAPAYPDVLAKLLGPLHGGSTTVVHPGISRARTRNELSAYTSQIASDMWLPQVALWSLSRHAFQVSRQGTAESIAAVLLIEGLARQLRVASPGPILRGTNVDRDRLAELVAPLAALPTIELRSAAARLWAELYGEPLVRLVDDVFGE